MKQPLLPSFTYLYLRSSSDSVSVMREGGSKPKSKKDTQVISEGVSQEQIAQTMSFVPSLKEVSLEVRRKEARKPLYLKRYE
jgi:hypothetical protein